MQTQQYMLPLIGGNMANDIVRDMNALAEASEVALKGLDGRKAEKQELLQKQKKHWLDITEFGAVANSDSSNGIQAAIDSANPGDVVFIPGSLFILDKTIRLKSGIKLIGAASSSVLKMKDGANLAQMIYLAPSQNSHNYGIEIYNFQLDGNKENNPTSGHGILLNTTYKAFVKDIKVSNFKGKGIYFSGNSLKNTNTNYVKDCFVYGCDEEGVYFDEYCSDMHIYGGDYGSNKLANIVLSSPSSSVRTSTVWGSREGSGIIISANTPSVQIMSNQIEGNAKHGVEVHSSHILITSNKIYDNAEFGNAELYSGVFLSNTHLDNAAILDNTIFSGLYEGTGRHKHAIEFADSSHKGASIFGNSMRYMGHGQRDLTRSIVSGLNLSEDQSDFSWVNTFFDARLNTEQVIPAAVWTKVKFDAVGRNADSEFNTTTNTFVCSQTAVYQFETHATLQNALDQDLVLMEFWVNEGAIKYRVHSEKTGGTGWYMAKGNITLSLAKGDRLSVHIFSNAGGSLFSTAVHSRFTGKVIR